MPKLIRESAVRSVIEQFDPSQTAVLESTERVVQVIGAPGTGKTSVAVELLARGVRGGLRPDQCVLLSPTRVGAGALRSLVTANIAGTSSEPIARTPGALAFSILRAKASLEGLPTPRLLTGPEQDVVIKELLAGHAQGLGALPKWPRELELALPTRGFRNELRDLLMRSVEWGLSASDLARLGRETGRAEWEAAATFLAEYDDVTALSRPGAYDPAWILGAGESALREDDELRQRYHDQFQLIVIDDSQELTHAALGFLRQFVGPKTRLVLLGDPDVTVQSFRGADPRNMYDVAAQLGPATQYRLEEGHRLPAALDEVRERVSSAIGVVGSAAHRAVRRRPAAQVERAGTGERVQVALLRSAAQEAAHIAGYLRHAHLIDNVAWRDMAVIVRGSAGSSALRRALNAARVPVAVPPATLALREEPAVRPFLTALDVVTASDSRAMTADAPPSAGPVGGPMDSSTDDTAMAKPTLATEPAPDSAGQTGLVEAAGVADDASAQPRVLDVEVAIDLLTSALGQADPVALRRLRRALRAHELAAGGSRTSDELLGAVLLDPVLAAAIGPDGAPARRVARVLGAGQHALAAGGQRADAEHVLWAMWEASKLAEPWQRAALDGGVTGTRADRDLDAMLALFSAAGTFVDRLPGARARDFLDSIRNQDVPGDRLVAAAPDDDAVQLLTPAAAAGNSWHTVVVAGVQEGVWPDLRLRGSVLGSTELVDLLAGRGESVQERIAAVRYDETRQFLVAITRARGQLMVTAVRDEEEHPSALIDLVDPVSEHGGARAFTPVARPMTLASMVAEARRQLASDDPELVEEAAQRLAYLADADVPGADPSSWWALVALSDDRPLRDPNDPVRVSPSKIEGFHDCGLRWLLTTHGGFGPSIGAATLGTLIHELAQEFAAAPASERMQLMLDALDERWPRMGLGDGFESRREKARAQRMVQRLSGYLDETDANRWRGVASEKRFNTTIGRAVLAGAVDRVEVHPEHGARIIDFKTGSTKPPNADIPLHPQLAAYQLASLEGAFGPHENAGAALVQIGGDTQKHAVQVQSRLTDPDEDTAAGENVAEAGDAGVSSSAQAPHSNEPPPGSLSWARQLLADTADGMGSDSFTAQISSKCSMCSVRSACPLQPEGRSL